jgi:hypothetical protein
VLFAIEERAHTTRLRSLVEGYLRRAGFPGQYKGQRVWFRELIERANVEHELHFIDASDALCKGQLADRSKSLPNGVPWTTEAEFAAITAYFKPPSEDEHFNVVRHPR